MQTSIASPTFVTSMHTSCHDYPESSENKQLEERDRVRRSLQMHIMLTSGLSTVCNIDKTAPTIARAVVVLESPHHDNIVLFCANICKTDSSQQLRRLVIPLEHSNDPSVPTPSVYAWPPNNIHCRRPVEVLFFHRQERLQWATARQHWRYQVKVGSIIRRRMAEYGSGEEEVNVMQMHV